MKYTLILIGCVLLIGCFGGVCLEYDDPRCSLDQTSSTIHIELQIIDKITLTPIPNANVKVDVVKWYGYDNAGECCYDDKFIRSEIGLTDMNGLFSFDVILTTYYSNDGGKLYVYVNKDNYTSKKELVYISPENATEPVFRIISLINLMNQP